MLHKKPVNPSQRNNTRYATRQTPTVSWVALLTVLFGAYILNRLQLLGSPAFAMASPTVTVHDQPVTALPLDVQCREKTTGISDGKICKIEGKTYYLKLFPHASSKSEIGAKKRKLGMVCFEEFNRQFVKNNIGVDVPSTRFFRESLKSGDEQFYIASEEIDGLMKPSLEKAYNGPKRHEYAKLAVASTFIADLHDGNFGFTKNGLVLIDVDSVNHKPENIAEYKDRASYFMKNPHLKLSLDDVRVMIEIYQRMKTRSLPKFHKDFKLNQEMYLDLLNTYIDVCHTTISAVRSSQPGLSAKEPNRVINNALSYFMTTPVQHIQRIQP